MKFSCEIDLIKMSNDMVLVIINLGEFTHDKVVYRILGAIQGSYEIKDFWNLCRNF